MSASSPIPDVQGKPDLRNIAIDQVGVKDVVYPIRLARPARHGGGSQSTVATLNMYVSLPKEKKGTHMSRFVEILSQQSGGGGTGGNRAGGEGPGFAPDDIIPMTRLIAQRLSADVAHLEAKFTYFIAKKAPVTGQVGLIDYAAGFRCAASADGSMTDLIMSVMAPATSLCPCSKEISQYGAHNQRCHIEAQVRCDPAKPTLWIEDLVEILEGAASAPVYSVLKRPDEKFVTEQAYDNPKFVEDIIRDLAIGLNREERVTWYSISSENFESIHNHNAFARITRDKSKPG